MPKDLHAFPGGSSRGTYNGIYPLDPLFWQARSKLGNLSGPEIGHLIYGKALEWPLGMPFRPLSSCVLRLEGLEGDAKAAVEGISPMNEPGHLAGIVKPSFARLPEILAWMAEAISMFRASPLAHKAGMQVSRAFSALHLRPKSLVLAFSEAQMKLYINLIEPLDVAI